MPIKSAAPILFKALLLAMLAWLAATCGGGGGGDGGSVEQAVIKGKVIDGYVGGAIVCADLNGSGRCDAGEPNTLSDSAGAYQLAINANFAGPLVAEVVAGQSRDSGQPGGTVDVSYRMASPSTQYSTDITPFTTLVHLAGERNFRLAEDMVRLAIGLPPGFAMNVDFAATPGSLAQEVAKSVAAALKVTAPTLDWSSAGAMEKVAAALPPALTQLPVLTINTKNAAPIVSKETYVDATFTLTNPALSPLAAALNGKIRGRGHSTWGQPKNPYKVQFKDDAAYAQIADVVGMKKSRNWVLLADYFDRSLMRNKLAFSLGNSSVFSDGLKWTPSGQHVEVYLNEDYVGVYLLAEDIRIDPARLAIKKMSSDPAANDLDGGYIVEVDARLDCYNVGALNLQHHTPQGVPVCIDTPDESAITLNQLAYIKNLLDGAEQDLYARGNPEKIDMASFADWYLLSELFRNNDCIFWSSVFLWKDTAAAASARDRVLNLGPIWDFDISAGNINYNDNWKTEGCWVAKPYVPNWLARLFDNADFLGLTLSRWKQKRPALEKFINFTVDTGSRRLAQAQQRNFARWPVLGMPMTNYYTFSTYADEVAFLKRFLNERMAWLDKAYESPESFNALCK